MKDLLGYAMYQDTPNVQIILPETPQSFTVGNINVRPSKSNLTTTSASHHQYRTHRSGPLFFIKNAD
jgi:hypothetical protein